MACHKSAKANYPICKAIRKYGWDKFELEIIEEVNQDELSIRETYWIKSFDSINPQVGYNLIEASITSFGHVVTQETRDKIRQKAKERNLAGENNPFYRGIHSEETIKKISNANKGKKLSPEHVEKLKQMLSKRTGNRHPLSIKVINSETGKVYSSICEAAAENNINHSTLNDYLRGRSKNKTKLKIYDEVGSD